MATYAELRTASESPALLIQVKVACIIAADTVSLESAATPLHAERLLWAKRVYENPDTMAQRMVWAVLAKNKAATPAQIAAATDAAVQTNVDAAVNVLATVG